MSVFAILTKGQNLWSDGCMHFRIIGSDDGRVLSLLLAKDVSLRGGIIRETVISVQMIWRDVGDAATTGWNLINPLKLET